MEYISFFLLKETRFCPEIAPAGYIYKTEGLKLIDGDTADTQTIIEDEETNYLSLYTISVRLSLISVSFLLRHKAFYYIWFQTKTFLQVWSYINYIDFVVTSFVYFHVNKGKGVWTSAYGNSNVQKTQK